MPPRNLQRVRPTGFTLIEILVVVAIIILLLAVLLPSLRNARELSRATVCGTQLNQIFAATLMYAHANSDRLPHFAGDWSFDYGPHSWWWVSQIARNLGNNLAVYKCPSDDDPYQKWVVSVNGSIRMAMPHDSGPVPLDISYRGRCDTIEAAPEGGYRARKITSWRRPGRVLLLLEGDPQFTCAGDCVRTRWHLSKLNERTTYYAHTPWFHSWKQHLGRTNVLFMDGHVERLTPTQLSKLANLQEYYLDPSL